MPSKMCA